MLWLGRGKSKRVECMMIPPVEVITGKALAELIELCVECLALGRVGSRWLWERCWLGKAGFVSGEGCVPIDEEWPELLWQSHWRK